MKEKILASLKNKYKNMGFSDKVLEQMAEQLATTVKEEADIDNAVAGVENLLKGFQSHADQRVNDAVAKAKKEAAEKPEPKPAGTDPEPKDDPAKPDGVPEWAKQLVESNKKLTEKLAALESGSTADKRKQVLEEKLANVNQKLRDKVLKDFSRMNFKDDAEFDTFVEETVSDLGEFQQAETEQNMGKQGKPLQANTGGAKVKEASKEEAKGVVDQIM